jgi:hypothetical protein
VLSQDRTRRIGTSIRRRSAVEPLELPTRLLADPVIDRKEPDHGIIGVFRHACAVFSECQIPMLCSVAAGLAKVRLVSSPILMKSMRSCSASSRRFIDLSNEPAISRFSAIPTAKAARRPLRRSATSAIVTTRLAPDALDAFLSNDRNHPQPRNRICPPPTQHCI